MNLKVTAVSLLIGLIPVQSLASDFGTLTCKGTLKVSQGGQQKVSPNEMTLLVASKNGALLFGAEGEFGFSRANLGKFEESLFSSQVGTSVHFGSSEGKFAKGPYAGQDFFFSFNFVKQSNKASGTFTLVLVSEQAETGYVYEALSCR